jgi:hypothetical protein
VIGFLLNHYVIKPHTEEKKAKLASHHEYIKTVLKKWLEIKMDLSKTKTGFTDISIPLYSNLIDETKRYDEFNEVSDHLRSNRYVSIAQKLQQLDVVENEYNHCIDRIVPKHEVEYLQLIKNVKDLIIFDEQKFLSAIFEYFRRLSVNEDVSLVEDTHQEHKNDPFFYRRLRFSHDDENPIIDTLNIKHQVVTDLKKTIDETASKIVPNLRDCNEKFKLIQSKYSELSDDLNQVIHDAESLGVYGNCRIEEKLKNRRKFIRMLKSMFKLKQS